MKKLIRKILCYILGHRTVITSKPEFVDGIGYVDGICRRCYKFYVKPK